VGCKHQASRYSVAEGNARWIKIKIRNRGYSQVIGRDELFEHRYEAKGAPEIGGNAWQEQLRRSFDLLNRTGHL
jgi:hypothetical protein